MLIWGTPVLSHQPWKGRAHRKVVWPMGRAQCGALSPCSRRGGAFQAGCRRVNPNHKTEGSENILDSR